MIQISPKVTLDGDTVASNYAKLNLVDWISDKNLEIVNVSPTPGTSVLKDSSPDAWGTVKFSHMLYGFDPDDDQALYYTATLSERLEIQKFQRSRCGSC